jgi:subtilisin family serine protease
MKYKKISLSVAVLLPILALTFLATSTTTNNDSPPASLPTTTSDSQPNKKIDTTTEQTTDDNSDSPKARKTITNNRYSSAILKKYSGYPELQYYLLESVNDPNHSSTWSHDTIQAERAWDLTTGSSNVTVAVIDTGYALNHQELANAWHINEGEQGTTQSGDPCWTGSPQNKQTNGCDDDQNGPTDDWKGYDFFHNDNDPSAGTTNPTGAGTQHGTMVSGVIGAAANNGIASAGIDHNAKIMPLQVFDDEGTAYTSDIVAAIEYATDNGANVINLSLGSNGYDAPMEAAVQYATNQGVLVVAASGNCALNSEEFCNNLATPGRMTWPALYDETLAVGATTNTDARASYSSYGPKLDMVAPGSGITPLPVYTSANQVSAYATANGTSFAAPLTAGVASLLLAQNPSLTPDEMITVLTESTEQPSGMNGATFTTQYGYGRLNAHKATLLGLANTQLEQLGPGISQRMPAVGAIWRSQSGATANDEYSLVGCRITLNDLCSLTIENSSITRISPFRAEKGDEIQYIFVPGSALNSGNNLLSVHNREYASEVGTLTK